MARTVKEIKDEMTAEFISNSTVVEKYGLDSTKTFEEQFSKASIESILFYVFAFCAWTVEKLFDTHKAEVTNYIDEMKPHTLRWYVNKVKDFRFGQSLIGDTDRYSDEGLTEEEIDAMKIVKYASADEIDGKLYIKVAKDNGGVRSVLTSEEETALLYYVKEMKDAGVKVEIRNAPAVKFAIDIDIYYNPQIINSEGVSLSDGGTPVADAIKNYIENLPFNGEYRNVDLVDKLQQVRGVSIPELHAAYSKITNESAYSVINAVEYPYSGYYAFDQDNSKINYIPYANI